MWHFDFCFHSRVYKVAARALLGSTIAHKVNHNSGLKRAKQKIEKSGPAPVVVQLEQTVNTVSQHVNYAKTDTKISSVCSPMFCMEINDRAREIKLVFHNLK